MAPNYITDDESDVEVYFLGEKEVKAVESNPSIPAYEGRRKRRCSDILMDPRTMGDGQQLVS